MSQGNKKNRAIAPGDKASSPESTTSKTDTATNEVDNEGFTFRDNIEYTKWSGGASHTVSSDELIIISGSELVVALKS